MDTITLDLQRPLPLPPLRVVPDERPRLDVPGCLHELFERQVDLRPHATAVHHEGEILTYVELDRRANQLARCLRAQGAGPGSLVGLYFERSVHPIIAILACLKAGVAYVPIDPVYPGERIRHIVEEAELALVLSEEALEEKAREHFPVPLLSLDGDAEEIARHSPWRLLPTDAGVSPEDLCYVIYTSGTTGRPKGVMTEHGNAYRFVLAFNEVCQATPGDRVYQGFSLGFDGSVEEMWMAFSNGASLVVPDRQAPRFGNELAAYLVRHGVTYFSTVPTLLSTMTEDIPSLRYLVVSGEKCPPELVARWARPGRRMLNVYGPTEATVNTTSVDCVPGRPITIGKPLRGYDAYILDEAMRPVRHGEKGELYIGGETLARGYLKRPDLTGERFVPAPAFASGLRLYRTGDLVRWNDEGELEFFGRIDGQVKIRGFRVELSEIESLLLEHERIRSASVKLFERDGLQELAAFVVLDSPQATLDRTEVLNRLAARVPDYMIPGYLDVLDELPMLTSGKVDRARLPSPVSPLVRDRGAVVAPESPLEDLIASVWQKTLGVPRVSTVDDFFLDLGGHSLLAAQMVTRLRHESGREVTVRDAYRFPTVRALAAHLASLAHRERPTAEVPPETSRTVFESLAPATRGATAALQALSVYGMFALGTTPFCVAFLLALGAYTGQIPLGRATAFGLLLGLGTWPVILALTIAAKWILIGRYREGEHPVWGFHYFRWWLVSRLQALNGAAAFSGTPLMSLYYRLMGAKVGRGCTIESGHAVAWDLISIGDDTSIGADSQLLGYRVEDGKLRFGRIDIGSRCFVGIHSALGLGSRMEDDSALDDQSLLADGAVIPQGEARRGSPAQPAKIELPERPAPVASPLRAAAFSIAHLALSYAAAIVMTVPALVVAIAWYLAFIRGGVTALAVALVVSVPAGFVLTCVYFALVKRAVLGRAAPGTYDVHSIFYLRKWLSDGLMRASRGMLLPLYTTLYLPPWLRLLGARIGARAELSTVWYFSPEMVDVGEESFFADGSIVGGKRIHRGRFTIGENRIGRRSFVGNSAILPTGAGLGDRCLLGVLSCPPSSRVADGSEWLGSPAFSLPNRQKVGGFTDAVTFRPTTKLYLQRAIVDALRILIPGYTGLAALVASGILVYLSLQRLGTLATFALAPLYAMAIALASFLFVVVLKKAVMGKFQPVIKPLWSMYVWLNEMVNGAYESVASPALVPLLGTPFVAPLLRLMGCRIGKHCFIESTLFSEWDLVEIGDYAALNAGAIIQTHLFEDRVMKSSHLKIGDECSVGNMAVVLYDTEMARGVTLGPLSLMMKGETFAPFTRWHGIPTVQTGKASVTAREVS